MVKVLQVGAPTPRLTRFNVVNGILNRIFTQLRSVNGCSSYVVVFGYRGAARDIHFGERGRPKYASSASLAAAKLGKT